MVLLAPCRSPDLPEPAPHAAGPAPQCEEIKTTAQKHMQSLRQHSKEELNRLNQAIQRLTVEVDSTKSQVRGKRGQRGGDGRSVSTI